VFGPPTARAVPRSAYSTASRSRSAASSSWAIRRWGAPVAARSIAKLLIKARSCHERLGSQTVFAQYVSDLRTEQKRKRNLMKILNQHHL
jgi:hypothetical protein